MVVVGSLVKHDDHRRLFELWPLNHEMHGFAVQREVNDSSCTYSRLGEIVVVEPRNVRFSSLPKLLISGSAGLARPTLVPALIPALSRPFLRLGCVPIDLFPNNSFRGFVEVGVQGRLQLKVFRPKRVVEKRPRRANHHCGVALTLIAIRFEPVSPAKRRKEASLPLIRHGNLRLGQRLRLDRRVERLADPLNRGRRGLAFARGRGTLK
jgi:hypothetical protein